MRRLVHHWRALRLLGHGDRSRTRTIPLTLCIARGNHAQGEQNDQYPQYVWLAFHLDASPFKAFFARWTGDYFYRSCGAVRLKAGIVC